LIKAIDPISPGSTALIAPFTARDPRSGFERDSNLRRARDGRSVAQVNHAVAIDVRDIWSGIRRRVGIGTDANPIFPTRGQGHRHRKP
jgi:hypothetical protein